MNKINLALGHISKILEITDKDIVRVNITHAGSSYKNVFINREVINRIFKGELITGELTFESDFEYDFYIFTSC